MFGGKEDKAKALKLQGGVAQMVRAQDSYPPKGADGSSEKYYM
jgi:hypothetical protein